MRFIFPPRPSGKTMFNTLDSRESSGLWFSQWKYRGTRTQIHIDGENVKDYERNGRSHKQYVMNLATKKQILGLNLGGERKVVLDGELMHSKNKDMKNITVLYDVLWYDGVYLRGTTVKERMEKLVDICFGEGKNLESFIADSDSYEGKERGFFVSTNIMIAPTFSRNFLKRYKEAIEDDSREGLVLKQKDAKMTNFGNGSPSANEVIWQVRCRKPEKNYLL